MITALIISAILCLHVSWAFYWLNLHTPIQTRIPALAGPLGVALLFFALGGVLL